MSTKIKIEGDDFKKVKALADKAKEYHAEAEKMREKLHKDLWSEINKIAKLDENKVYMADTTHEDLGFYIITEPMGGGLEQLTALIEKLESEVNGKKKVKPEIKKFQASNVVDINSSKYKH